MFAPSVWSWPQWTALILMFLAFGMTAVQHGNERKPEKYNGFIGLSRFALWTFILVFGGFFG